MITTDKVTILTAEILLKFGFKGEKEIFYYGYGKPWKIEYIHPWGQGNMDEGWNLSYSLPFKNTYTRIPFSGYRDTLSGKMPNGYILFVHQLQNIFLVLQGQKLSYS